MWPINRRKAIEQNFLSVTETQQKSLRYTLNKRKIKQPKSVESQDHIKISQFTKFEVLSLDCNYAEGFQKSEMGDDISELETPGWNLSDL